MCYTLYRERITLQQRKSETWTAFPQSSSCKPVSPSPSVQHQRIENISISPRKMSWRRGGWRNCDTNIFRQLHTLKWQPGNCQKSGKRKMNAGELSPLHSRNWKTFWKIVKTACIGFGIIGLYKSAYHTQ